MREELGGHQGLRHAATGDGIGRSRGITEQNDSGRDAGARAALERRSAQQIAKLLRAVEARGQLGLREGPATERRVPMILRARLHPRVRPRRIRD